MHLDSQLKNIHHGQMTMYYYEIIGLIIERYHDYGQLRIVPIFYIILLYDDLF